MGTFGHYWVPYGVCTTQNNGPQKLLIIGPDPFISHSSPDHSPQPRIDFSYYEISGPDICSLICAWTYTITYLFGCILLLRICQEATLSRINFIALIRLVVRQLVTTCQM